MSILRWLIITTFIITPCLSQTDAASFAITTSSFSDSGTNAIVTLTLSWNTHQYQCIINGIQPHSSYECFLYKEPKATIITDSLPTSQYLMKIELQGNNSNSIKFAGITIRDEDNNHYDIDTFCLPSQFRNTSAESIDMQELHCCYWSQRQKYNDFAMGNDKPALIISYIQFRDDVLNHKNEFHEGAVKPPKITTLGIKTLSTSTAGSETKFNIKLHWDTDEYSWNNLIPKNVHTTYQTSFSSVSDTCPFLTGFNLELSASIDESETFDDIGIDSIIVEDEAGYYYTIDTFCMSHSIDDSTITCSDSNSNEGFIYDGNGSVYFMWDNSLFQNVNQLQEAFVIDDYIILQWLHSSTCSDVITPYSKVTIAKDNMSDAASTGWTFSGNYKATVDGAINCPGGALNKCAQIAGGGTMEHSSDISAYINIIVQYEMRLSSMPAEKRCYLHYAFDDSAFQVGQYKESTDTTAVLYHNESFLVPDHSVQGYTTLRIKFSNDATENTAYCWFDNFYVFGDYLIEYDNCNDSSGWQLSGTSFTTDNNCPDSTCLPLTTSNAYGTKTYSNIELYSNIVLTIDVQINSQLVVNYSYDTEQSNRMLPIFSNGTRQIFHVEDADICASTLYIKFMTETDSQSYVDNIKLSGTILKTLGPTTAPTPYPSMSPTIPTTNPTLDPTVEPTTPYPTTEPTTYLPTEVSKSINKTKDNSSNMTVTIVVIFVVVVVFVVMFVAGWWYYKKRKMKAPGADLSKPLLSLQNFSKNKGGKVKGVIELNAQESYDMMNVGHPIPGVGIHGETGEQINSDEFSNSDSENGLAQQLQENLEKDSNATASVMGDQFISDEMKEAEFIGVVNETPQ